MRIYVTTQGAKIVKEAGHLLVRHGDSIRHTIFVHKIKQLIICGNIDITPTARNILFRNNIDTVFLSRNGRFLGRFSDLEPKNIHLRKRQFRLLDDQRFGLPFCKQVVSGKLANMSVMLMRIYRKRAKKHIAEKSRQIRKIIHSINDAESIESLRGHEGSGSALYFSLFNNGFDADQKFVTRVRRPPTDPVNAVLSLTYTFLYNQVYSAVRQVNLDPYIGYLHSLDYGRYSLVLDLMEEFRPIIADTLTFSLFNMGILDREEDFRIIDENQKNDGTDEEENKDQTVANSINVGGKGENGHFFDTPVQRMSEIFSLPPATVLARRPVYLRQDAMKRVITQFERKLATSFVYELEDRKITYAEAIVRQARQYRKLVEGSVAVYQPLLMR